MGVAGEGREQATETVEGRHSESAVKVEHEDSQTGEKN